jgi:lipopolysaccharide transport system permease protein
LQPKKGTKAVNNAKPLSHQPNVTVIKPIKGWIGIDFRELWRYRELVFFLIWRDVKVRYKQTLLGAAWAILKPLFSMVVFTVIFGNLAHLPTDDVPPPLFYFTGLLPWIFFQDGITKASNSLVSGRNLITKVYFPRLAIPLSSVIAGLVDFALAFLVLIGMMLFYNFSPTSAIWVLPFFLLLVMLTSLGSGLWLAALNVAYRDIGYVTPFIVQAWLYASPVVYSATLIEGDFWQVIYGLNPMAGVVQGFRWAILGVGQPPSASLAASIVVALIILISGVMYFRRMEQTFADVV